MVLSRFQSNLRFALSKESAKVRNIIPLNRPEQIGNWLSWPVYEFRNHFVRSITDPRFVTICLTLIAMIVTALLFYPSTTWDILLNTLGWIVSHINWSYVRFGLWILSEVTIFGLGIRAFGRFSNQKLMEYHGLGLRAE